MELATAPNTYLQRLIGAMSLDSAIYEEVEADEDATLQAFATVVFSSVAAGIGARGFGSQTPPDIALISAIAVLAWAAWALVTFVDTGDRDGDRPWPRVRADVVVSRIRDWAMWRLD